MTAFYKPTGRAAESFHRAAALAAESSARPLPGDDTELFADAASRRFDVRGAPRAAQVVVYLGKEVQRINLIIEPPGYFNKDDSGIVKAPLPPELLAVVSEVELRPWLDELAGIGRLLNTACVDGCCVLGCALLPCLWYCMWRLQARLTLRWNDALLDWQRRMNEQLMTPRGMMVKTQSHCQLMRYGDDVEYPVERWLTVAMHPAEAVLLSREPHTTGDKERPCCTEPGAHQLCMHH